MATLKEIALAASTLSNSEHLHSDDVRKLGKAYLSELQKLEAQHRNTWALAINKLWDEWKEHRDDHGMMEDLFVYHLNRCPPIEETKGE